MIAARTKIVQNTSSNFLLSYIEKYSIKVITNELSKSFDETTIVKKGINEAMLTTSLIEANSVNKKTKTKPIFFLLSIYPKSLKAK